MSSHQAGTVVLDGLEVDRMAGNGLSATAGCRPGTVMPTFHYLGHNPRNKSGTSFKLWRITVNGRVLRTTWGPVKVVKRKVVPVGKYQSKSWRYRTPAIAREEMRYRIGAKLAKGYRPAGNSGRAGQSRQAPSVPFRAISIRQPFAELILRGLKREEYRSQPTRIRERVYIYAALAKAGEAADWRRISRERRSLPTGVVVGTVKIVECRWDGRRMCYAYQLAAPRRLRRPLMPTNHPQPRFWRPTFR